MDLKNPNVESRKLMSIRYPIFDDQAEMLNIYLVEYEKNNH